MEGGCRCRAVFIYYIEDYLLFYFFTDTNACETSFQGEIRVCA